MKVWTKATNFLKFCTSNEGGMALASTTGFLSEDCAAGEGRIYTGLGEDAAGSGLFFS